MTPHFLTSRSEWNKEQSDDRVKELRIRFWWPTFSVDTSPTFPDWIVDLIPNLQSRALQLFLWYEQGWHLQTYKPAGFIYYLFNCFYKHWRHCLSWNRLLSLFFVTHSLRSWGRFKEFRLRLTQVKNLNTKEVEKSVKNILKTGNLFESFQGGKGLSRNCLLNNEISFTWKKNFNSLTMTSLSPQKVVAAQ